MIENELFCEFRDEGNRQSFERLYKMIRPWLYRMIYRIVGSNMAAEDVLNNTWERVFLMGHRFDKKKGNFNNYIFSIGKNEALKWIMENKGNIEYVQNYIKNSSDDMSQAPEDITERLELSIVIQNCLKKLKEDERNCILWFYFSYLEIKEISKMFDIPEGQVKSLLFRSREKLRKMPNLIKYANSLLSIIFLIISELSCW